MHAKQVSQNVAYVILAALCVVALVALFFMGSPKPAHADEIVFPPKLAGCGTDVVTAPMWNEKVYGLTTGDGQPYMLNSVRIIVAGSRQVRVQVGPRNLMPVLDVVLEDFVVAPPFDITRNLGAVPLPSGNELVVRIACVDGQFPDDTALATVILQVSR